MHAHPVWSIAFVLLVSPVFAQETPPVFEEQLDVDIVNLEVYVTDKKGKPVRGLGRDDFELLIAGKPVEISNFYAVEDGRRAAAEALEDGGEMAAATAAAAEPLFLVVFFDNVYVGQFTRNRLIEELRSFLPERLRLGEQVMLVSFNGSVRLHQAFTGDRALLDAALDAIMAEPTHGSLWEREEQRVLEDMLTLSDLNTESQNANVPKNRCPRELPRMARTYSREVHSRVAASVDALSGFVATLASLPGRKALVYVSDGIPFQPGIELFEYLAQYCGGGEARVYDNRGEITTTNSVGEDPNDDPVGLGLFNPVLSNDRYDGREAALETASVNAGQLFADLTRYANANRVTFFPVETYGPRSSSSTSARVRDARGLERRADEARWASLQSSLKTMADDTGGRAVLNTLDFAPALDHLSQDFVNYYSLGFRLPESEEAAVDVRVRASKLTVRHRKLVRSQSLADELAGRTQAALMYGMVDNPLAIELRVGDAREMDAGLHLVPIRVAIPLGKIVLLPEDGMFRGRLRLFLSARDRNGRFAPVRTAEIPIHIPSDQVETARQKLYIYEVKMLMKEGDHTVAVGLHDDIGAVTSYLKEDVAVVQ